MESLRNLCYSFPRLHSAVDFLEWRGGKKKVLLLSWRRKHGAPFWARRGKLSEGALKCHTPCYGKKPFFLSPNPPQPLSNAASRRRCQDLIKISRRKIFITSISPTLSSSQIANAALGRTCPNPANDFCIRRHLPFHAIFHAKKVQERIPAGLPRGDRRLGFHMSFGSEYFSTSI